MADLPDEFDIIILGTGLSETVVAAAFSRIGLKVLHLDRNDYYGGSFGNFNLVGLETWEQKNNDLAKQSEFVTDSEVREDVKNLLEDGENVILLPSERPQAYHIKSQFHVRERTETEEEAAAETKKLSSRLNFLSFCPPPPDSSSALSTDVETSPALSTDVETSPALSTDVERKDKEDLHKEQQSFASETEKVSQQTGSDCHGEKIETGMDEESLLGKGDSSEQTLSTDDKDKSHLTDDKDKSHEKKQDPLTARDDQSHCDTTNTCVANELSSSVEENVKKCTEGKQSSVSEDDMKPEQCVETNPNPNPNRSKDFTAGDIRDEWRRYCFDISPRVLHSCGELVELLIQSDVARYCEFRTVSRILTQLKDKIQQVPCSRADVFSSKSVSLIEKRLMMKFLQSAVDYTQNPQQYQDYLGLPFVDFLKSKKLTANIQHYIQHAIAMVTDASPTEDGLKKTHKFLHSLGRYGNTAFLFPLYGTGELPQAFSRLSAVFGGIYCLALTATHLITDNDSKCCGIITSGGQRIKCKYVIAEASYLPDTFIKKLSNRRLSRAIYITSSSVLPADDAELSLMNFVGVQDQNRPVTVLELPPSACVCPKNVFVVHLTRVAGSCNDAEDDLKEVRENLFAVSKNDEEKPKILWSMYFTQDDTSQVELSEKAPGNILVTSGGGDFNLDMDLCVQEAKQIFHTICPGEDFLPKPPNPEDIIHVDDTDATVAGGPSEFESKGDEDESTKKENLTSENVEENVEENLKCEGNEKIEEKGCPVQDKVTST